ncbi:Salmolysin [Roseibium alexandrii]|uniref:Salmolysin n=2 Tax=Roseibium alexandrii TaxID=388408 RepID=A0A0M7ANQ5_9HYPH|nr:Salmolysin [Roseibium alexandrii]
MDASNWDNKEDGREMDATLAACKSIFQDIARFRGLLFDRLIAPYGLTMSQARVLLHLLAEDKLTQSDIARRIDVGTVTVGGLVDRLEARGLVERRADPVDRRAKRVCLTDEARPLEKIMDACSAEVDGASFKGLPETSIHVLLSNLQAVRQNLLETLNKDAG